MKTVHDDGPTDEISPLLINIFGLWTGKSRMMGMRTNEMCI